MEDCLESTGSGLFCESATFGRTLTRMVCVRAEKRRRRWRA